MRLLVLAVIVGLVMGCAAPVTSSSPPVAKAPAPTPSTSPPAPDVVVDCPAAPIMGPSPGVDGDVWCAPLEDAVDVALGQIGFKPQTITISPLGIPCHDPFRMHTVGCRWYGAAVAYVAFVGSADVAAFDFPSTTEGAEPARLIAFGVPPAGWTIPHWSIP